MKVTPQAAACIMMVAKGYPESYPKGDVIQGIANVTDSLVFHAGTALNANGETITNGGRVICVTSLADTLNDALDKSYQSVEKIQWQNKYFRRDIGKDVLPQE
jgi:phosphoribosylamine--glycine ligase